MRLTGFHDASAKKTEPHDRAWQCYTAINRHTKRHYLSDAIVEAVAGFCVEKKVFWRYDLPTELTAELKRKTELQETCTITINLLELLGIVVYAWVMLELVGDRPDAAGDPILMRGDSMAAVSWASQSGGATEKKGKRTTYLRECWGALNSQADGTTTQNIFQACRSLKRAGFHGGLGGCWQTRSGG